MPPWSPSSTPTARSAVNKASAAADADAPPVVTVRVYDFYGLGDTYRRAALAVTSEAFADAGLDIAWIECVGPDMPAACAGPLGRGDMVLRLIQYQHRDPHILGTAMVQPNGPNVMASVYTPALIDRAMASHVPLSTVVGRVAAHEIAHLLLGSNSHSSIGLMRPDWNIRRTNPDDWRFSSREVEALQRSRTPSEPGRAGGVRTAN